VEFSASIFQLSGIYQRPSPSKSLSVSCLNIYIFKNIINIVEKIKRNKNKIKNQIFIIDLKIYQFKYNSSRIEELEKERRRVFVGIERR
jgi:hypothetical protein